MPTLFNEKANTAQDIIIINVQHKTSILFYGLISP